MKLVITADNGAVCETEAEAEAIDKSLAALVPADEYGEALKESGLSRQAVTRRVNVAKEYIAYLETEKVPEMPAKKPETKEKGNE